MLRLLALAALALPAAALEMAQITADWTIDIDATVEATAKAKQVDEMTLKEMREEMVKSGDTPVFAIKTDHIEVNMGRSRTEKAWIRDFASTGADTATFSLQPDDETGLKLPGTFALAANGNLTLSFKKSDEPMELVLRRQVAPADSASAATPQP